MTRTLADFMWAMLFRIAITLFVGRAMAQYLAMYYHQLYLVIHRFDVFLR
ncbi:MAG: hypothetical protein ANABAC_1291 [Anaerolineae bacterium]|nr:MAG: hypothetical protein ANABAC_1291 [Anaerolineae bacterium]